MGGKFTLTEAGDVSKLTANIVNALGGHAACNIKGVLRADNAGAPGAVVSNGISPAVAVADNYDGEKDFVFSVAPSLAVAAYWLMLIGDASAVGCAFYASATTGGSSGYGTDSYASPGSISGWSAASYQMCIYGTYTVATVKHNLMMMGCGTA
jgi:hypothetical protein